MISTRLLAGASFAALAAFATPAMAGDVAGTVSDETNTVALQSATVSVPALGREAVTARDGSFSIADLPAGTYEVVVRYVGAPTVTRSITVPESGLVTANFTLGGDNQIVVVGQAANQASALSRKYASDGVSDVLTRDAIGQFPDQNVAESLRRLPGINVLNDQGEGRFVSVRGLDPELNATSLNGVRVPAPEGDVRSVALDVISSDIIESIEVKKSLTPDMDADTIGASIEINTTSAFNRRRDLLSVKVEGSYNDYSGVVSPKGSIDFATHVTDNFGVSGGISYYHREFETDNIEAADWNEADGVVFAEEVEYRDYDVERERISGTLNLDYRVSPFTMVFARGSFSQFDDQEYRRRTTLIFDEDPASGDDNSAFFTDADGRIEVRRDLKDRFERQQISTTQLGLEHDDGEWKANLSGSWARASEKEDFSVDPIRFRNRFDGDGLDIAMDYSDRRVPLFTASGNVADFLDPASYGFNRLELTTLSRSVDEEYALKGDLGRTFVTGDGEFTVQGGVKSRWRDKSFDFNGTYYGDFDGDLTLADMLGTQTYRLTDMGPVADKYAAATFFRANESSFEADQYETDLLSLPEDFSAKEDVLAGYLMGRYSSDTLRVIGGVRAERTNVQLQGQLVADDGDDVTDVIPLTFDRDYTDWLPSFTVRYQTENDIVLRLAGSRSLVRPKLSKLVPVFTVNDDLEAEFGNPDLEPYRAWNADAAIEFYLPGNGAFTFGMFYKSIDNFIVDQTTPESGSFQGIEYDELTRAINGDTATVFGVEVGFSRSLDFLPAPLDGFLVQANYTFTDAKGTVFTDGDASEPRDITLPKASRNTGNLVLGYENGPLELRAAGTYRSKYLDELGGDASEDRYVDHHFQLDLSAKVEVIENVRLFAEWINVNNAKFFAYQNFDSRQRLLQFEEYGSTVKFGAKVNF
ncbi:TonB-dependent receptor [Aurantiacibacter suaedae]|uniref:TonB-dependent receptor n=1 Tax=Aurantiacibacter suaedae TaxID=2545755 RepID=UPI0010F59669|nr:TonB-dependent receptor [Aurantiacibacter suaedae]